MPSEIKAVRDKSEVIPDELLHPGFYDERFRCATGGQTIFLAPDVVAVQNDFGADYVVGAEYIHSGVLAKRWGNPKLHYSKVAARQLVGNCSTAAYYEAVLQYVHEDSSLVLQHIVAALNRSTGHSYHTYGISWTAE